MQTIYTSYRKNRLHSSTKKERLNIRIEDRIRSRNLLGLPLSAADKKYISQCTEEKF
ncbi:hypothetical protein QUR06_000270 [Escherichia coli]|nr:hypothetical protein [Escherichia coli]